MGILGHAWGTAEELLHPRDRFGRFARKRAMPEATGKKVLGFLDRFNPRQFQSDAQASQYLFNKAKHGVFEGEDLRRLHFDWDEANDHIRAGDIDPETQRFIDMMDRGSVALPEQIIVTKTVGPEAFGLTPEQLDLEEGGLRDLQGRLFADRGYSVGVVGTPMGKAQGRIAITIATPRGTKAIIPARSGTDRGIFFERGQRIRVTKVKPDGLGGWQIMAIAEPEGLTPGQTPEPLMPGRRGAGLSEAQRRERITPSMTPQQRLDAAGNPPLAQRAAEQRGEVPAAQPAPQAAPAPASPSPAPGPTPAPAPAQAPAPATPATGVPERQEQIQTDSVGPAATKGTSPAEIAQGADDAAQQQAQVDSTPAPATPESFRQALSAAKLKSPSRGKRQKEFNDAFNGIVGGKVGPEDALRQLDTDIEVNKRQLERQKAGTEKPDPELEQDIKDQEALADLISSHHGVSRRGQGETAEAPTPAPAAPAKRAAKAGAKATKAPAKKAGPAPTPGAPSTSKEATPKAPEPAPDKRTKAELLAEAGDAGRARMTKEQLRKVIADRAAGPSAPAAGTPVAEKGTGRAALTPDQERRLLARGAEFRGKERNDEERRIVGLADEIEARKGIEKRISGSETRSEMRKRTGTPELSDEQKADIKAKVDRVSARFQKEQADYDAKNKADLAPLLESAGLQEDDLDDLDKTGASLILGQIREKKISKTEGVRRLKASKSERLQKLGDALGAQPRKAAPAKAVAKKATPAKAAPTPEDAEEEVFKARVAEAGLPDRVTALRAMAKDKKIRGFSTMNKRQLQSALLGDEVKTSNKIGVVPPAKMIPHLEAAKSDQDARALLDKHTLVDLKALAKERGIKLPSKGATKAKVTDMVLEDIRGPQEGIQGRTPDTGLEEDLSNLGYISLPGPNGDAINAEIDKTQPDSPEALRLHRDNLEALSKQFRKDGDKDAANMAQAAADAMGMRAQTISGVEEAAPPVKRVAKKAAPEVPEGEEAPEVERPIEKMLKPELLALAQREGASVRPGWTKAKILDEIKRNRRMDSSRGPETAEERLRRELSGTPGGAERFQGPTAGPLQLPDRAPTLEEIQRDNPDLDIQKMFNDSGLPHDPGGMVSEAQARLKEEGPDSAAEFLRRESDRMLERIPATRKFEAGRQGVTDLELDQSEARMRAEAQQVRDIADKIEATTPPPVKKATKKAAKKAVAQVDKAAANMAEQVRGTEDGAGGTFGDMLKRATPAETEELREEIRKQGLEPRGKTAEELFDNSIKDMLENRMRELGMLPDDPKKPTKAQKRVPKGSVKGPKADVPISTPDRRQNFIDAWNQQPGFTNDESMVEIRDRIADGEFTHEEGVRRLESEISFNEEEISDLGAELRGLAPEDRDDATAIRARRAELQDTITSQKKAIKFLRGYAKDEAPVTRQELEIQLDGPELAALQRADVEDLKKAARDEGLGNIEGDDKDTVVQNIGKAVARREMANREKEQKARDRQAEADQKVTRAQVIANIEDVMDGSNRAIQTRIQTMRRSGGISQEQETALNDAFISGGREELQRALDRLAGESGLRRRDKRGDKTRFDPERHDLPPGSGLKKGDPVTVLRPGYRADVQGDDIQVHKAKVTAGHEDGPGVPEAPSAPEAPPTLPRTSGTAVGRTTTARLRPGTRIMVQRSTTNEGEVLPTTKKTGAIPVTVTKIERNRLTQGSVTRAAQVGYRVTAKDDDGNEVTIYTRPGSQTHMLEPPPKAPKATKKAAQAAQDEADIRGLRNLAEGGFQQGPITGKPARRETQDLLSELINDDDPLSREEVGARIADLDRAQLQEMAKTLGIPAGSRRTIPDTRRSIVEATVGRRLDSIAIRGFRGDRPGAPEPDLPEGSPARVLAESHQVTSTPLRLPSVAPKATEDPKRHNAELIGAGLDLEPKGEDKRWLDAVQSELDAGVDGRQIANNLRRDADATRAGGVLRLGDWVDDREAGPPEVEAGRAQRRAERQAERAKLDARVDRMELMADRLEGVRPIKKAAPPAPAKAAPSGPARREMGTMAAATAQSRALQDLKSGKSHAEVATALRKAATSVGSKDHDPQFVRPLEFSPAERASMKRADAKALRELAAEIQAQGVAQRAAAKAAKKAAAPAKKAAPKTPEQDRKDLTGTTGELATAMIDQALERLQAANTPEEERAAISGLLRPELATLARKLGLKSDRAKSVMINGIIERVKGREAPTTSAERAVPKVEAPSVGGVNESEPLTNFPHDDNMRMHADSPTMQLAFAYERAGRNGSANRMARLRARATTPGKGSDRLTPQQVVDELRAIRAQETDAKFQRMLDRAIEANDAPMTPLPEIPADTPPLARQLLEDLHAIPYARKGPGSEGGAGLTHGPSLVDQLAEVYRDAGRGERGRERRHPVDRIRAILRNKIHELNDPAFRIWELTSRFESDESSDTGKKVTELEKQIRDWERSHWPK